MALPVQWKNWVLKALLNGTSATEILSTLMQNGFRFEDAKAVLGSNLPASVKSPLNDDFYLKLSKPAFLNNAAFEYRDIGKALGVGHQIQLYSFPDFLSADECNAIIRATDNRFTPSTIAAESGYASHRTSTTCNLTFLDAPIVGAVEQKIVSLLQLGIGETEVMQAQRYQLGQEFKAHTDYFEPGTEAFRQHATVRGQRTWTCMIYLNRVELGGETEFIALNHAVKPEQGTALVWNNLLPNGTVNPMTIHHAHPVKNGEKYVITKWFRTFNQ
ncbi:prolyl hydroxylase family protein [Alteromonas sp. a30]|uniref:prolyl hydroxylase family protein n=1 Tax=Alteromonas sp. a30 TaxID=2730917 RepID=UPI0022821BF9|nr:2OG-Fe(II) oxygenase [Alteromonas sp. a30]MCY7296044.1 2OG-Fe(II) oxygenase [Alteromonas sp. a30]